ncbi:hypothetical protein FRC11_009004, partial [Ceratobasidium sp. 423]
IKVGGAANKICIHKEFYDDECGWRKAEKVVSYDSKTSDGLRVALPAASEVEDENTGREFSGTVQFDSIDNRHISNVGVVESRLQRLPNNTPHAEQVPARDVIQALSVERVETQPDQSAASMETENNAEQPEGPPAEAMQASPHKRTRRSRRRKPSLQNETPSTQPESPTKRSSARLNARAIEPGVTPTAQPPAKRIRAEPPREMAHERSDSSDHEILASAARPAAPSLAGLSRIDEPSRYARMPTLRTPDRDDPTPSDGLQSTRRFPTRT